MCSASVVHPLIEVTSEHRTSCNLPIMSLGNSLRITPGMDRAPHSKLTTTELEKSPSGITGLDEITHGGLPRGRPTLICGTAGCGKTLFGMEFLVRGAT